MTEDDGEEGHRLTDPVQKLDVLMASPHLIVGIGASAGGLNAFKSFFQNMPPDSGMSFVLVQHLDPTHESMLAELLSRQTRMPVSEAVDDAPIERDHIYIIPPDATLTIKASRLRVVKPAPPREHRHPIDTFFTSLAEDQGDCAVCIVLSGTGSDGTIGLRAIKEHGGLTMAQGEFGPDDPTAMSGMPHSAVATGLVDHVLPVEKIPAALIEYMQHLTDVAPLKDSDGTRIDASDHMPSIIAQVRSGTGHDFSQYKINTLIRRVQRRMQVLRIDEMSAFIERLKKDPEQVELMFREFLISVTNFFRDPEAFDALLATALPELLSRTAPDDPIRIWVPGCATGEEAYSLAILVKEAITAQGIVCRVQIFGTDIDEAAVAIARSGRYRKAMVGMSPERIERWFAIDGEDFCPIREIREMCVFSTHSVVKDPPFSKLDLISCRNLMIYLEPNLQDRVVRTFHYALRPGGVLYLGSSEGVTRAAKLFSVIDKKHRIFQRLETANPPFPALAASSPPVQGSQRAPAIATAPRAQEGIDSGVLRILKKLSPAFVVIDRNYDILTFSSGEIGRYLAPSPGSASLNLFDILNISIRSAARNALRQMTAPDGAGIAIETAVIELGARSLRIEVLAEPLPEGGADVGLAVVAFRELGEYASVPPQEGEGPAIPRFHLSELELELQAVKSRLQATIDDLEASNEELKSTNEEFQSVNEELQSTNEELETAKEETQSINEELHTINAEMQSKNEILTALNSDLKNIFLSTEIATIFLDSKLRIKNFTPGMTQIFHLRDGDRGRPITEIVTKLRDTDLQKDAKNVLRTLATVEREVRIDDNNATFIMRIRPYRTVDNVIDGVVITFVDFTAHRLHEESKSRLSAIVDSSQDAIISHDLDGLITSWNNGAERIFGYVAGEAIGKPLSILLRPDQTDNVPDILDALKRGERLEHFENDRMRKDGTSIDLSLTISPIKDENGKMIAASTIAREFTDRKLIDKNKSLLISELNHRIKNLMMVMSSLITRTIKGTKTQEDFAEAIDGRIQALSRVQDLLIDNSWDEASLRAIVEGELEPYRDIHGSENIIIGEIDCVVLTPHATLPLTMALHELATNAAKYGAFSRQGGCVDVSWSVVQADSEPVVTLIWVERGGPLVVQPTRRGFGSRLIERSLSYELHADVAQEYLPDGLRCTIRLPLDKKIGRRISDADK
jgi:two-component system CheB/CheR fusion protein